MGKLMNVLEVAEYLGVQPSTIYQWTHQDFIPHIKLGKFLRFRLADVDSWLDKKAVAGRTRRRIDVTDLT
jgi:excisionase family DNA binding protein